MTLLARNTETSHSDLASHITPTMAEVTDLSTMDRFQQAGEAAMEVLDMMVTRQAAMVAYIDDYWLMMWMSLAAVPLVLIMRKSSGAAPRAGPPEH